MTYELIYEKWLEWKPKIVVLGCLILCFVSGYGAGRGEQRRSPVRQSYINYNTNGGATKNRPRTDTTPNDNLIEALDCPVKGNIGSGGTKTYHISGGAFYNRTTPEECFPDETSALAKGYKKSSR